MRNITRAGLLMAAALSVGMLIGPSPSGAQADLDCGDPGTSPNMPVDPNNDPHRLDDDDDGIGCEDPSASGGEPAPDAPAEAPAAAPLPAEPTFTG
jgi:hypothetical protein